MLLYEHHDFLMATRHPSTDERPFLEPRAVFSNLASVDQYHVDVSRIAQAIVSTIQHKHSR